MYEKKNEKVFIHFLKIDCLFWVLTGADARADFFIPYS